MSKKYLGTFHSIDSALYKITELTSNGCPEEDIHAIANTDDEIAQLRNQSSVALDGQGDSGFLKRFTADTTGTVNALAEIEGMGFSAEESGSIVEEIRHGGIALFVESESYPTSGDLADERDSRAYMTGSGEPLENSDDLEPRNENEGTVPRLNTDGL